MSKTLMKINRAFCFSVILCGLCESLKDVRVMIPAAVKKGDYAVLVCLYDLEDDSLYSLKWYKGRNEFFRFTPKDNPSMKFFPLHNLNLLQKACNATQVTLHHVELSVAGRYSCEVSADAPSFHTALVSGDMDIVEIPVGEPLILGLKPRYQLGDMLLANCSSAWSKPAANLSWFINEEHAPVNHTISYPILKEKKGEREFSRLGLRFKITPQLFSGGRLKIRCSASIHSIFWKSSEKSVEEEKPRGVNFGNGGSQLVHPVSTAQSVGIKYGDQDDKNEIAVDTSMSGCVNVSNIFMWPYIFLASSLVLASTS